MSWRVSPSNNQYSQVGVVYLWPPLLFSVAQNLAQKLQHQPPEVLVTRCNKLYAIEMFCMCVCVCIVCIYQCMSTVRQRMRNFYVFPCIFCRAFYGMLLHCIWQLVFIYTRLYAIMRLLCGFGMVSGFCVIDVFFVFFVFIEIKNFVQIF